MEANNSWKKVVYREGDAVRCIQGETTDKGDFLEVKGDYKHVLVSKHTIVSISSRQTGDEHGNPK